MKMKRFLGSGAALCAALCAALTAAALLALAGCSGSSNNTAAPTLVSIAAETTKDAYLVGQDLELDTITVTGTYSDGSTKTVPITGTNIAGYDKAQAGEQTLTVTVEGKTATFTVTVSAPVNAQAPVISVQPQSGAYAIGAAVTLSVTAASPDGGTLSYQWHSAVSGGSWTAIEGATEASYMPSTAAEGAVSYYARITNTNNGTSGTKTATVNSATVTVTVSTAITTGTGVFSYTAWVNEDDSLISDMPEYFDISRADVETLVFTAAAGLTGLRWSINHLDLPAPQGTAQSIALEAVNYPAGEYTLGLYAEKSAGETTVPYSINITFMVIN
jgi:hypothetical protein